MRIRSRAARLVVAALLVAGGSLVATAGTASATFLPGDLCKGAGYAGEKVNVPFSADGGKLRMGAIPQGYDITGFGVDKGSSVQGLGLIAGLAGGGGGSVSLDQLGLSGQGGGGIGALFGIFGGGGKGYNKHGELDFAKKLFVCGKKKNVPDCYDNGKGNGNHRCDDRDRDRDRDQCNGKNRPSWCDNDRDRDRDQCNGKNRPSWCDNDRDRDRCGGKDRPSWCDNDRDRCDSKNKDYDREYCAKPVRQPGPPRQTLPQLPNTGFDSVWLLYVAGGLMVGGAAIIATPRLRTLATRRRDNA